MIHGTHDVPPPPKRPTGGKSPVPTPRDAPANPLAGLAGRRKLLVELQDRDPKDPRAPDLPAQVRRRGCKKNYFEILF